MLSLFCHLSFHRAVTLNPSDHSSQGFLLCKGCPTVSPPHHPSKDFSFPPPYPRVSSCTVCPGTTSPLEPSLLTPSHSTARDPSWCRAQPSHPWGSTVGPLTFPSTVQTLLQHQGCGRSRTRPAAPPKATSSPPAPRPAPPPVHSKGSRGVPDPAGPALPREKLEKSGGNFSASSWQVPWPGGPGGERESGAVRECFFFPFSCLSSSKSR